MTQKTQSLPKVAIVGPINSGKSTLFNRLGGKRMAVTSDTPGTTRDRQNVEIIWNQTTFELIDTAGLSFSNLEDPILENNVRKQIQKAQVLADVLILTADGKLEPGVFDKNILREFRKSKKPLILAVNKIDSPKNHEEILAKFSALGIKEMHLVSAQTGQGTGDLLDAVVSALPASKGKIKANDNNAKALIAPSIKIAIVGKPNAGKSSLVNKILDDERMVTSPIAGTTRTAIDSEIILDLKTQDSNLKSQSFTLIDTAGLKRKAKKQLEPDIFSSFQVYHSIRKSDICFFVLDGVENLTHQDLAIAGNIVKENKGCVILINKADKLPKKDRIKSQDYATIFPQLWMCPVIFTSALTGEGLQEALLESVQIYEKRQKQIPEETLKKLLDKQMKVNPPKRLRDQKVPKVFSLTQIGTNPPTFELLVNTPSAIQEQFKMSLQKNLTKTLDFFGTPIKLLVKKKI